MKFARTLKEFFIRYAFLARLFVSSFLIITITVLLFSAQNYRDHARMINHSQYNHCQTIAVIVCNQMEEYVNSLYSISSRIHIQMNSLYGRGLPSVSEEMDLIESLRMFCAGNPFVQHIGFYLPIKEENTLYMNTGKYQLDIFAKNVMKTEPDAFRSFFMDDSPFFVEWNQDSMLSMRVIPFRNFSANHTFGYTLYIFSSLSLSSALRGVLPSECRLYSITAPDGSNLFLDDSLTREYKPSTSDFKRIYLKGIPHFFISFTNENGWGCQLMIPESMFIIMNEQYNLLSDQYFLLSLFACFLGILLLCAINYLPVHRLVRSVLGKRTRNTNEISALRDNYLSQMEDQEQLRIQLRQERMMLIDRVYDSLLRKLPASKQEVEILHHHMPSYIVACVRLEDDVLRQLENRANNLASPIHVMNFDKSLVLICRVTKDGDEGKTEALKNIRYLTGNAVVTLSDVSKNLYDLFSCFRQASEAMYELYQPQEAISPIALAETAETNNLTDYDKRELKIIRYIEANFTDPLLSTSSIAEMLGISESTTGRMLRSMFGSGFRRFVNEKRLTYAKSLLSVSDYSISTIAEMAGFQSASYFIKMFKGTEDVTPAQYREMIKQVEKEEEALLLEER